MRVNALSVYFIGGALTFNVLAEAKLHSYWAPEPHIPHPIHCSAGTNDLTYIVSATTAGTEKFWGRVPKQVRIMYMPQTLNGIL